jgi:microcystin-dependent protein
MTLTTAGGATQSLGVSGIIPRWRGVWTAFSLYYPGERVRDPNGPTTWIAVQGHVSNTFSGEVAQGFWQEEIDADALTDALALDVLGNVIPTAPANAYLRVNAGENGIEARTAEQARADLGVVNRAGDTMTGALVLPGQNPTLENQATRKGYVDAIVAAVIAAANPPGKIDAFAMSSPPTGWLFCDGSAVSRTTYAALFDKIGTAHGIGDGATTFNLPDYRGVFLRGFDAGRGLDPGRAFPSYQGDALGSHAHSGTTSSNGNHQHGTGGWGGQGGGISNDWRAGSSSNNYILQYGGTDMFVTNTSGAHNHTFDTTAVGGAETRPKNVAVYYCIKT